MKFEFSRLSFKIIVLWVLHSSCLAKIVASGQWVCVPATNLVAMESFSQENICQLQVAGTPDRLTDSQMNTGNDLASYRVVSERKTVSRNFDEVGYRCQDCVSTATKFQQFYYRKRVDKSAKMKELIAKIVFFPVGEHILHQNKWMC